MIKISLYGRHSNRTPFSYSTFNKYLANDFCHVKPELADLLIFGFVQDLENNLPEIIKFLDVNPDLKILILSEEPLWDTLWTSSFPLRNFNVKTTSGLVNSNYFCHENSKIFDYETIPYFLLTDEKYIQHYQFLFSRSNILNPSLMKERWSSLSRTIAFFLEKRVDNSFGKKINKDTFGLSKFRSDLANKFASLPDALIQGAGWNEGLKRQDLVDWHWNKLTQIDMRYRFVGAIENTHQLNYVSEKIIDSFAAFAIPIYSNSPSHFVKKLAHESSYINLYGLDVSESFDRIVGHKLSDEFVGAYIDQIRYFKSIFFNVDLINNEFERVASMIRKEISSIL